MTYYRKPRGAYSKAFLLFIARAGYPIVITALLWACACAWQPDWLTSRERVWLVVMLTGAAWSISYLVTSLKREREEWESYLAMLDQVEQRMIQERDKEGTDRAAKWINEYEEAGCDCGKAK